MYVLDVNLLLEERIFSAIDFHLAVIFAIILLYNSIFVTFVMLLNLVIYGMLNDMKFIFMYTQIFLIPWCGGEEYVSLTNDAAFLQ